VTTPTFGISTHLFHGERLDRRHLDDIASFGFESVELFATGSHFNYHDRPTLDRLATWLRDAGLRLHAIHAPVVQKYEGSKGLGLISNATMDEPARRAAVHEAELALEVAKALPATFLVVHLGVPQADAVGIGNSLEAARQSVEEIQALAEPLGVRLALEIIPNSLSNPATLVGLLENELEIADAGVCFDFGHAFIMGDLIDAIEVSSGHLVTTHVHDNGGRTDAHLVPFEGSIDWSSTLMAMQKIGYEGTYMFEVANSGSARSVLENAQRARRRFEAMLSEEPLAMPSPEVEN
jgi:sugar phosphate isomerase/epimerase